MRMKKNIVFALKLFYLKFFSSPELTVRGGGGEVVGANIVINTIIAMMQCAPV